MGDSLLNKVLKLSKTKKGHNYHLISSADQYNAEFREDLCGLKLMNLHKMILKELLKFLGPQFHL